MFYDLHGDKCKVGLRSGCEENKVSDSNSGSPVCSPLFLWISPDRANMKSLLLLNVHMSTEGD